MPIGYFAGADWLACWAAVTAGARNPIPWEGRLPQHGSTIDETEVARFDAAAAVWWDPEGEARWLHRYNPVRLEYIRRAGCRRRQQQPVPVSADMMTVYCEPADGKAYPGTQSPRTVPEPGDLARELAAHPATSLVVLGPSVTICEAVEFAADQRLRRPTLGVVLLRHEVAVDVLAAPGKTALVQT